MKKMKNRQIPKSLPRMRSGLRAQREKQHVFIFQAFAEHCVLDIAVGAGSSCGRHSLLPWSSGGRCVELGGGG